MREPVSDANRVLRRRGKTMARQDEDRGKCKSGRCDNRKRTAGTWGAVGAVAGLILGGPVGAAICGAAGAAIGDEAAKNECHDKRKKQS